MKILLNTTFFLPAVGIAIEDVPNNVPVGLMQKGHKICLSDITIFEISAKASKYVLNGKIDPIEVTRGLNAIIHDRRIERISTYETQVLTRAFKLRTKLADFIDCLIISSAAASECDGLITEDKAIFDLAARREFAGLVSPMREGFHVRKVDFFL